MRKINTNLSIGLEVVGKIESKFLNAEKENEGGSLGRRARFGGGYYEL